MGKNPKTIEPLVPVDLVVDHSVMIDHYGTKDALDLNMKLEFERNSERYQFMKWGMQAFDTFGVVPPGIGIVHQVNLEYLARGVHQKDGVYYPDSLVGTDSHTTMVNGVGVVAWGVGGIEAEAGMLGQPVYFLTPDVVGVELKGKLNEGITATDLVLTVTEMLRKEKVVGKFVEFFGEGTASLSVPDRATIGNMAPEYGATMGFFPVDQATVDYLADTGRTPAEIDAFASYFKAQRHVRHPARGRDRLHEGRVARPADDQAVARRTEAPAGPHRARQPQGQVHRALQQADRRERVREAGGRARASASSRRSSATGVGAISDASMQLSNGAAPRDVVEMVNNRPTPDRFAEPGGKHVSIGNGDVLIAAITSCTNTSNPGVLLAAGLLAKKAVERGLTVQAAHQDVARAGLAHGHRLPDQGRDCCPISSSSASTSPRTAARRASATPATSRPRSTTRSSPTT